MRTHLFELINEISENTDLTAQSVCYKVDCIEAIMVDRYDQQKYHIVIKPTELEKL